MQNSLYSDKVVSFTFDGEKRFSKIYDMVYNDNILCLLVMVTENYRLGIIPLSECEYYNPKESK